MTDVSMLAGTHDNTLLGAFGEPGHGGRPDGRARGDIDPDGRIVRCECGGVSRTYLDDPAADQAHDQLGLIGSVPDRHRRAFRTDTGQSLGRSLKMDDVAGAARARIG